MRTLFGLAVAITAGTAQAQFGDSGTGASTASSARSSNESTGATSSQNAGSYSSYTAAGSALLLAAGGIITTTVAVGQSKARRLRRAEQRRAMEAPVPDPPPPPPLAPLPLPPAPAEPTPPPLPPQSMAPSLDAMVAARDWLLANQLQLKQDLALGAGPAVDDLAGLTEIDPAHRVHFGKLLQRNRSLFVTSRELTPEEAAKVMAALGSLVMADRLLGASLR